MKLPRSRPCGNRSAIHSASRTSVLRPGPALICWALITRSSNAPSSRLYPGFQYTPPPILPIGRGIVRRGRRRRRAHTEDHANLLFIDFNAFDQSTGDVPAGLKISVLEAIFDFGSKEFQPSQNQTPLFLHL